MPESSVSLPSTMDGSKTGMDHETVSSSSTESLVVAGFRPQMSRSAWSFSSLSSECSDSSEADDWEVEPEEPDQVSPLLSEAYQSLKDKIQTRIDSGDKFFSLEFFPPRTKGGAVNLLSMFERMGGAGALFIDVTWHPAGNPAGDHETSSMGIANAALNYCGMDTMLHMTCLGKPEEVITEYLEKAKRLGIRNILALRGDPISEDISASAGNHLRYAVELVRHIRKQFGKHFVIGVAGYPCGHPEASSYEEDLQHLKEKVDAGADLIISQLFFKPENFISFVRDCRRIGITIPIIPGLMPIQSYESLRHIVKLSKLEVPEEIKGILEPLKWKHEAVRNYGIRQCVDMIKELFKADVAPGLHFYTLNREIATERILKEIGLWDSGPQRFLPWKAPANVKRCKEDVRPIFWAKRPKSYIYRTQKWDEFPNGRWGNSQSPAFGELKDYYLFYLKNRNQKEELLQMWGERLTSQKDVWDVFYHFITGIPNVRGVKVTTMPWSDSELEPETELLKDKLADLNRKGVLTINSQPSVNGLPSEDPVHGWGPKGGYVYQKAYLEFFTSPENVECLLSLLPSYPTINYHAIDKKGRVNLTNINRHRPIAVTWGVFPGAEIMQPTVVDTRSFKVWKDEAFTLWTEQWGKLYQLETESSRIIDEIANSYILVNLVDNEFVKPTKLWELLDEMFEQRKKKTNNPPARP